MLARERIASRFGPATVVSGIQTSFWTHKCLEPERDLNGWLASTLETQGGWTDAKELLHVVMAAPFSVLPETNAALALGLRVLFEEEPERVRELESEFETLLMPAFRLVEGGLFPCVWERMNPWTAARYPAVGEGISMTFPDLPFLSPAMTARFQ